MGDAGHAGPRDRATAGPRTSIDVRPAWVITRRRLTASAAAVTAVCVTLTLVLLFFDARQGPPLLVYYNPGTRAVYLNPRLTPLEDPSVFGRPAWWTEDASPWKQLLDRLGGERSLSKSYPILRVSEPGRYGAPEGWEAWVVGADRVPEQAEVDTDLIGSGECVGPDLEIRSRVRIRPGGMVEWIDGTEGGRPGARWGVFDRMVWVDLPEAVVRRWASLDGSAVCFSRTPGDAVLPGVAHDFALVRVDDESAGDAR